MPPLREEVVSEQLELAFEVPAEPVLPLTIVTVCVCGARCPVEVEGGAAARWDGAVMWGLVALDAHRREGCPGPPSPFQ